MSDRIYVRTDGKMEVLQAKSFDDEQEDVLQKLIAEHPDLVSGGQIRPENPLRWILITREQGIAEELGVGNRWAVDHLLIDQDARPTLVEVKRRKNPEVRRAVVGQLLEYAAHARRSWDIDDLRRTFEARDDWENELRGLLDANDALDADELGPKADEFWEEVGTNLRASNLRLLIVSDEIPDSLARVVEFLNEQMRDVDVLAVEVKRYMGGRRETFVPRVIGRSAKPSATPGGGGGILTMDEIVDRFPNGPIREAVQQLIKRARDAGATFEPGSRGFSIRMKCSVWPQPVTVAWMYPPSVTSGWMKTRHFSFGAAIFDYDPPPPAGLRDVLIQYASEFEGDSYTHDASSKGVVASYAEPEDAARHIDTLVARLTRVLTDIKALEPVEGAGRP
ncbi:MAG: hypothetical protein OXH07_00840 [Chloroflexi bacterium]|nr:hypothetical protein [Chloroflexota bacterium]